MPSSTSTPPPALPCLRAAPCPKAPLLVQPWVPFPVACAVVVVVDVVVVGLLVAVGLGLQGGCSDNVAPALAMMDPAGAETSCSRPARVPKSPRLRPDWKSGCMRKNSRRSCAT